MTSMSQRKNHCDYKSIQKSTRVVDARCQRSERYVALLHDVEDKITACK